MVTRSSLLERQGDRSITRFVGLALLLHGACWLGLRVTASERHAAPQLVTSMRDVELAVEL
ncbi:MAG TPA: hypothetical protein VJN18_34575, partial [Polyangiaceae bacterium]|nr:hypothetical protein [Polyangiaceae bacterium]